MMCADAFALQVPCPTEKDLGEGRDEGTVELVERTHRVICSCDTLFLGLFSFHSFVDYTMSHTLNSPANPDCVTEHSPWAIKVLEVRLTLELLVMIDQYWLDLR